MDDDEKGEQYLGGRTTRCRRAPLSEPAAEGA